MLARHQVFVSSTYEDLIEERSAVVATLLRLNCIPAGMEFFPASEDSPLDIIHRLIDDSDYYVLIVAGRYGSIEHDSGRSFTELEYEYARERRKPILTFLHRCPADLLVKRRETDPVLAGQLASFMDRLKEGRGVAHWSHRDELAIRVAEGITHIRDSHPAEGWVRGRNAIGPAVERELAEKDAEIRRLAAQIDSVMACEVEQVDDDLARGTDPLELPCRVWWIPNDAPERRMSYETTLPTNWDAMFKRFGHLFMQEGSDDFLDDCLDEYADTRFRSEGRFSENGGELHSVRVTKAAMPKLIMQFVALGLLRLSLERHAVVDKSTYYTLTSAGRDLLMRLHAERRQPGT